MGRLDLALRWCADNFPLVEMGWLNLALRWCADNFRYYVIFRKSILFILGLIFSYKLVEKLFFNILITYLNHPSEDYNMQKAAIVVNLQGGICSFLTIILVFVADAYVGLFKMLVSSCILCIAGLVVTHFAAKKYADNFDEFVVMFYPALVLLTISEAATFVTLKSFLHDQLVVRNQLATAEEENPTEKRTEFWLYFISFFASILVLFGPLQNLSLEGITGVLAIALGASLFWFLLGFKFYNRVKPTGSALSDVPVVISSAIIKRNVAYPQSSEQLHQNSSGDVQILPHTSWLSRLGKLDNQTSPKSKKYMGLVVTHFAAKKFADNFDEFMVMFYPALVLLTISEAATFVTLKSFLHDQLVVRNQLATAEEENPTEKCTEFWLYFVSFFASILVLFGPLQNLSLEGITGVLAIALGASLFWFLLGFKFYNRVKPTGSALSDVPVVISSAIIKRNVAYPQSSEQLHQNSSGDVQIFPHTSWLRWLDRAAIVQEGRICCSVEQVKGVKYLLQMLPMWSTFITFSFVCASGDTFFLEEAGSITDDSFPLLLFINLQRFTQLVVSETLDHILEKLHEKMNFNAQRMMLVRIGIGMVCCVLCCIAAWIQAVHRLDLVDTYGEAKGYMSVYWLTPQFLLLAFMGGFSSNGLQNFFESQVSRSMFQYGPPFEECVNGIGRFASIVFILILSKWFKNGAESSRLDKYYRLLAILSSVNSIAYFLVARWYGDDTFVVADNHNINSALQVVIIGGEEQSESSPLLRRGVRSFPPSSVNRGVYNRFRSLPR